MKVIFLGTPDFAVKTLESIFNSRHEILAVVTQPDKPSGRSSLPMPSPVKEFALKNNIKVLQYKSISREAVNDLKNLAPDIMVTCAYGQILSQEIIDIPPHGIINVHASLLPKYRGAAPIQWAIINGETETGVTIMQTETGIDTGPIIAVSKTSILKDETAGELFERLSIIGASLLVKTLDDIENGTATFTPQNNNIASHVKMLKKADGIIDFGEKSETIINFIRGMTPWPGAYTYLFGKTLKVFKALRVESSSSVLCPGTIIHADSKNGLVVSCKDGAVRLISLQLEGKKRMEDVKFVLGQRLSDAGVVLGSDMKNG